jgi:hypothetical protein
MSPGQIRHRVPSLSSTIPAASCRAIRIRLHPSTISIRAARTPRPALIHRTGIANYVRELAAKRLDMIGEIVPSAPRIAMLFNPLNPISVETFRVERTKTTLH